MLDLHNPDVMRQALDQVRALIAEVEATLDPLDYAVRMTLLTALAARTIAGQHGDDVARRDLAVIKLAELVHQQADAEARFMPGKGRAN
jgi:hypothetical protein